MKPSICSFRKGNWIPFLLAAFCFITSAQTTTAQADQNVFVSVIYWKVAEGRDREFEKIMKENIKPAHQLQKQDDKIYAWRLYYVHDTGAADEYNYVSASYYDSWEKSEPDKNFLEIVKKANPKADAAAIVSKIRSFASIERQGFYRRADFVQPKTTNFKYLILNFMKVKEGMTDQYLKAEHEEWKPLHQALVDDGSRVAWTFWQLLLPGGSKTSHDYITVDAYSSYSQIYSESYENAFKKVHAGKDMQSMFDHTDKLRDNVRTELWEMIDTL
jgi:hypothetical protein